MPLPATSGARWLRGLLLALLLGGLEAALVRVVGGPHQLLIILGGAAGPDADPVAVVLALLGLLAELLGGYLLVGLTLRLLASLPGVAGRAAGRASRLLTVPAVRRTLDAAIAGVLLVQVVAGPAVAAPAAPSAQPPVAGAVAGPASDTPSRAAPPGVVAIAETTAAGRALGRQPRPPMPAESASPSPPGSSTAPSTFVPLPGWAAGTPAAHPPAASGFAPSVSPGQPASRTYRIRVGDTLWGIATAHLPSPLRGDATATAAYWRQIYHANQQRLGPDPDLIWPGVTITIPPYRPGS